MTASPGSWIINPKGLDPAVTFADGTNPPVTRTGAELMNAGIQVALKGRFVSEWIFLNLRLTQSTHRTP